MINETCDRCGKREYLFTYGYSKVGCHLCKKCAREWENYIQKVKGRQTEEWQEWHEVANKLLLDFLLQPKEKVCFT